MSAVTKILIGATLLAWIMHGPLGLGALCASQAGSVATAPSPTAPVPALPAPNAAAPATAATVTRCQTTVDAAINGKTINFASGGARVTPDSAPLLAAIASALKDCAGTIVEVAGHTDLQGEAAANMALSQARAAAVVAALAKDGVPADRLAAKGYGETQPVDATGPLNNPVNRRIIFTVATTGATTGASPAPAMPAATN